jgi:ubiquinone/menaquinone biosynthesis C-methylase UbiE
MAYLSRDEIISEYYAKYFESLCNTGMQGRGSSYFHNLIENYWENLSPKRILEVGAGSGEHLPYLKQATINDVDRYTLLDIRPEPDTFEGLLKNLEIRNPNFQPRKFEWMQGSVDKIPLPDVSVDRVISTCLFHHLENPLQAFQELRRVVGTGGEIAIGLPTDPGILNRAIKTMFTYPKARKIGIENPKLIYALEHRNHINGLVNIAKEVYKNDEIKVHYRPFGIKSWNLNLAVVVKVKKIEA